LKQTFRDADIVARLGGDEFVLFIPTFSGDSSNFYIRLQENIDRFNQQSERAYISISLGVQSGDLNNEFLLEQLVAKADQLMYEHKRAKRCLNR
jgi:diguanylate cyclase (GGDEF)-like protein